MPEQGNTEWEHGRRASLGILLVNLGTPDEPTPGAVRRYLAEFLSDRRVVDVPRPLWWLILHGVILRIRPARVARSYGRIWTEAGSPLLSISRQQLGALRERFDRVFAGRPIRVELAMRYGNPSLTQALERLREEGLERLLILPLYPQYSATTTATTFDAVARQLGLWRWLPEVRMVSHYHDEEAYVAALAASVQRAWGGGGRPDRLVFSFHGIPERYHRLGDPYPCQCRKTARLVAERLQLADSDWQVAFQSRFGREPWVRPYLDQVLEEWGRSGINRVDVISPGFAADCLETLEELEVENRDRFLAAGGSTYRYIPALNAEPAHIDLLEALVRRHCQGWPETAPDYDAERDRAERMASRERALAAGAKR